MIAIVVAATDGFTIRTPLFNLRAHRPLLALGVAIAMAAVSVKVGGRHAVGQDLTAIWDGLERCAPWIAGLAAVATIVNGVFAGTFAAGGADSYGYVSQAGLWRRGSLHIEQPLASTAPWPYPEWTLSPLGYRPALRPTAIVPTYAPGLPLAMAVFSGIAGEPAVFFVVPVLGAVAVWLTYVLGRMVYGSVTGLTAALLLASSPIFLFQLMQPMSDVPVTAWWLAAIVLTLKGASRNAVPGQSGSRALVLLAGLAASAAVLTRPNLAPLALVLAAFAALRSRSMAQGFVRATIFVLGALPGIVAAGMVQNTLYGSPFLSGYGEATDLFAWSNVWTNVMRYSRWLWETQTFVVLAAVAAPVLMTRARNGGVDRAAAWLLLITALAIVWAYLLYSPFDDWYYLRFLLPALPLVLILTAGVSLTLIRHFPKWSRAGLWVVMSTLLVSIYVETAEARQIFELRHFERRYIDVARFVSSALPTNAIVLATQHSGSLRYYANRTTLRWDWIEPAWLDRSLEFLRERGFAPYIVLEDWEEPGFRARFAGSSRIGELDWPPRAQVHRGPYVRLYDPADREVFLSGAPVVTEQIVIEQGGP